LTRRAVAAIAGREVLRLAYDRFQRNGAVPRRASGLDAAYLSSLLDTRVTSVEVLGGSEGTTDRVRLALTGDGVPDTVFVKTAPAAPVARLFGNLAGLGGDEVRFYRAIRPVLDLEAPACVAAAHDPRSRRFVLVLEDLEERGCTFPDVLQPFTLDQATAVLDTLAALHGRLHEQRAGTSADAAPAIDRSWIRANGRDPLLAAFAPAIRRAGDRLARDHPDVVPADGRALLADYRGIAGRLDAGPQTVLHGDPHPGNCYFDGSRAGLLDWQVVRRGNPLRDVTYFLVLGLTPELRREHQRALLDHYADALAAAGGPPLDADTMWTTYRRMAAYPYAAATFTAGLGGLQAKAIALEGVRRSALAITDLETRSALA
jgi:aminoglycoside phosphotransferase (APT) family kinase protein